VLGRGDQTPVLAEVDQILVDPVKSLAVNLLAHRLEERPIVFNELLTRAQASRSRTGRPHWVIVDEAHHLLPAAWHPAPQTLPQELEGLVAVTVHPERLSPSLLQAIDVVVAVGPETRETMTGFAKVTGHAVPDALPRSLSADEGVLWEIDGGEGEEAPTVVRFALGEPQGERRRHRRKYAEGELSEERSFWFRGADGRLNLRAQNLLTFMQVADGVDDDTWQFHRGRGDYSTWIRTTIKDDELAADVAAVEEDAAATPADGRARIRDAIERRYTVPA
jgi:hypothetical protein